MNKVLVISAAFLALGGLMWHFFHKEETESFSAVKTERIKEPEANVAVVAQGLEIPWSLDFLPDGSMVVTERPGRVRIVSPIEELLPEPALRLKDVAHVGEGGLLGIAVHPEFESNGFIYLYYTYRREGELANKVVRYRMNGNILTMDRVILDGIPGASIHNGGRIKFGPDGMLYVATGDAARPRLSQDLNSLAGKILRVRDDGTVPEDNPFPGSLVYSFGHRNPQGLTWDYNKVLWATEHGSRGTDEVNIIVAGKNYGWPMIRGSEAMGEMMRPILHSGETTWAPSGAAFYNGSIFFTGLRGQALFEVALKSGKPRFHSHFSNRFGRLRDVVVGPDNLMYVLTSNRDGRGDPSPEDDRIIRVTPVFLYRN